MFYLITFVSLMCRVFVIWHFSFCWKATESKAGGEADHRRSVDSSLAQLHRGARQCASIRSDDDGQGEIHNKKNDSRLYACLSINTYDTHKSKYAVYISVVFLQAVVAGIQQAHAEQLANMRIQDLNVSLKPIKFVNNPILRKRKLLGWVCVSLKLSWAVISLPLTFWALQNQTQRWTLHQRSGERTRGHKRGSGETERCYSTVHLATGWYVCMYAHTFWSLKDCFLCTVLCLFAGDNENEKLNEVMHEAWRFNRDCKLLRDGLQGLSWDGKCFCY